MYIINARKAVNLHEIHEGEKSRMRFFYLWRGCSFRYDEGRV